MEENKQMEYGEIDLVDYVKVIIRRKKLITAIFLVAIVAAGVISLILPKIYETNSLILVGGIESDGRPIEDMSQIRAKVDNDIYGVDVRKKLGISENMYPQVMAGNPKDTNLLDITIRSSDREQAKNIIEEINIMIVNEHREKINVGKELIENKIIADENKIKSTDSDIERINNKIKFIEEEKDNLELKVSALQKTLIYRQDPGTQFALFNTKEDLSAKKQQVEDLYREITNLSSQKENINSEINSFRASMDNLKFTRVVKEPTASDKITSPRPVLNVGIAAVLGLFIGVFVAFGKEWWEKNGKNMEV